jgi:hypothetical protein
MVRISRAGVGAGIVAALMLVASCGGDDGTSDAEAARDATTSSTAVDIATTTQPSASGVTKEPTELLEDEPPIRQDMASGSGCSPDASELPDGWWYGTIDGAVASEVMFDLACFYSGPAAEDAAAARGDEVVNDYYVVDDNPGERTLQVADDATARCVELGSEVELATCEPFEVRGDWAVWLRVVDGKIDRVVEQYLP